jgi:hypothetical protein
MAETSLARMIAILDLFKSPRAAWTADAIASAMDYSIPTVYRYVRELVACGLLRRDVGATFVLGPAATELDYHIRTGDPLIIGAAAPMAALAAQTGMDAVLATICGARIITVDLRSPARPVLHDDRLAQAFGHAGANLPRQLVGQAARGIGHDGRDGLGRKIPGLASPGQGQGQHAGQPYLLVQHCLLPLLFS